MVSGEGMMGRSGFLCAFVVVTVGALFLAGSRASAAPTNVQECGFFQPYDTGRCPVPQLPPNLVLVATLPTTPLTHVFPCPDGKGSYGVTDVYSNSKIYRLVPNGDDIATQRYYYPMAYVVYDFSRSQWDCFGNKTQIVSPNHVSGLSGHGLTNFVTEGVPHPLDLRGSYIRFFYRGPDRGYEAVIGGPDGDLTGSGLEHNPPPFARVGHYPVLDLCRADEIEWSTEAIQFPLTGGARVVEARITSDRPCYWLVHKGPFDHGRADYETNHAYYYRFGVGVADGNELGEPLPGKTFPNGYGSGTIRLHVAALGSAAPWDASLWVNDVSIPVTLGANASATPRLRHAGQVVGAASELHIKSPGHAPDVLPVDEPFTVDCTDAAGSTVACDWRLRVDLLAADTYVSGHLQTLNADVHSAALTPGGVFKAGFVTAPVVTSADAPDGAVRYLSLPNPVAGRMTFSVDCPNGSCSARSWKVDVKVPGLVALGDSPLILVAGKTAEHQQNQFVHPDLADALTKGAELFQKQLAAQNVPVAKRPRLVITDISLPYGGAFDVAGKMKVNGAKVASPAGDWLPPHHNHSAGKAADLRINFRPPEPQAQLSTEEARKVRHALEIAMGEVTRFGVNEGPDDDTNHWHVELKKPDRRKTARSTTPAYAATCAPSSPLPEARLTGTVMQIGVGSYRYAYRLEVPAASGSGIDAFQLPVAGPVTDLVAPSGWHAVSTDDKAGRTTVLFVADAAVLADDPSMDGEQPLSAMAVLPGGMLEGFSFSNPKGPGSVSFEAHGRLPTPTFSDEAEAEEYSRSCAGLDGSQLAGGDVVGPSEQTIVYLAEGATGSFFDTRLALLNPYPSATTVTMRFLRDDGQTIVQTLDLPAQTRRTVAVGSIPGLESANFSTVVESPSLVVIDRTMTWDRTGYGSHAETGVPAPARTWYLAEGSTSSDFSLFYLLQNPNDQATTATVRYLRPLGFPPIERTYELAPQSRTTIAVDGEQPELASTDVSAVITAIRPIIAERAMYKSTPTQTFAAGHGSAGVTAPSTTWFFAEGATGAFFDLFILLANPGDSAATVRVDYLLSTGETHTKTYQVPGNSRHTIFVDAEQLPEGSGIRPLVNVAVSTTITSNVPIIAERTMWWPSPELSANYWTEAHNSAGVAATGTKWALAEGEQGSALGTETYILIANTSSTAGRARVTLIFEDGSTAEREFDLTATSRTNVQVGSEIPAAAGKRFGAIVESIGPTPAQIVVERAMYTNPGGITWAAGTNAVATRLQ
jgi:hypothetical protein